MRYARKICGVVDGVVAVVPGAGGVGGFGIQERRADKIDGRVLGVGGAVIGDARQRKIRVVNVHALVFGGELERIHFLAHVAAQLEVEIDGQPEPGITQAAAQAVDVDIRRLDAVKVGSKRAAEGAGDGERGT